VHMIVFNLCCERDHHFEGWFDSTDDFHGQVERGLMRCPLCDSAIVNRLPSAPHLNLGNEPAPKQLIKAQGGMMRAVRELFQSLEDVGVGFAEEARKIHYREAPDRGIRGVATDEERRSLVEEGIEVFQLAIPELAK